MIKDDEERKEGKQRGNSDERKDGFPSLTLIPSIPQHNQSEIVQPGRGKEAEKGERK
jgi:hypothetical protein